MRRVHASARHSALTLRGDLRRERRRCIRCIRARGHACACGSRLSDGTDHREDMRQPSGRRRGGTHEQLAPLPAKELARRAHARCELLVDEQRHQLPHERTQRRRGSGGGGGRGGGGRGGGGGCGASASAGAVAVAAAAKALGSPRQQKAVKDQRSGVNGGAAPRHKAEGDRGALAVGRRAHPHHRRRAGRFECSGIHIRRRGGLTEGTEAERLSKPEESVAGGLLGIISGNQW